MANRATKREEKKEAGTVARSVVVPVDGFDLVLQRHVDIPPRRSSPTSSRAHAMHAHGGARMQVLQVTESGRGEEGRGGDTESRRKRKSESEREKERERESGRGEGWSSSVAPS
jgi:hypothetical protein